MPNDFNVRTLPMPGFCGHCWMFGLYTAYLLTAILAVPLLFVMWLFWLLPSARQVPFTRDWWCALRKWPTAAFVVAYDAYRKYRHDRYASCRHELLRMDFPCIGGIATMVIRDDDCRCKGVCNGMPVSEAVQVLTGRNEEEAGNLHMAALSDVLRNVHVDDVDERLRF